MYIDIFIIVLILLMLLRGIITGAFKYLYFLLAMICALLIAHFTAPQVAVFLHDLIKISISTGYTAAALTIWTAAVIVLRLCFSWLLGPILEHFLSTTNKVFGAIFGFTNGVIISYLLLWGLVNINNYFPNWQLLREIAPEESISFNLVRETNYLSEISLDLLPRLKQLASVIKEPSDSLPPELSNNDELQNLLKNNELITNLRNHKWSSLLKNQDILHILQNQALMEQINQQLSPKPEEKKN